MAATPVPTQEAWHRLRSPAGLARAVVVLLSVVVLTDLLALAAGLNVRSEFGDTGAHDSVVYTDSGAGRADQLYARAYSLQLLALLATAVVFVIWFRRVRLNAEVFDASLQQMKPGWAVGAWFVPVANFWLPRRIAGGVWAASAGADAGGNRDAHSTTPLDMWWTAWVLTLLFTRYASIQYNQAELPQEVVDAAESLMVADALDIVAAVLALLFVRRLTRMQGERAALGVNPDVRQTPAGSVPS